MKDMKPQNSYINAVQPNSTQSQKFFDTHDIYTAAALKTAGLKLVAVRKDGQRGIFVFEDTKDRPKLIMDFFNGDLEQNVKQYVNNWLALKTLVYQI